MTTSETSTTNGSSKESFKDNASRIAETAKEYVSEQVAEAKTAGQKAVDVSRDNMITAHQTFGDAVRRNPTTAVIGAVGLGILLGLAIRKGN